MGVENFTPDLLLAGINGHEDIYQPPFTMFESHPIFVVLTSLKTCFMTSLTLLYALLSSPLV